jgi:hypothetical protein
VVSGLLFSWNNELEKELKQRVDTIQSQTLSGENKTQGLANDEHSQTNVNVKIQAPPNFERLANRQNWYIYASEEHDYQFEYPQAASVSSGGSSTDDLWECVTVFYDPDMVTHGFIKIASPKTKLSCALPNFDLKGAPVTEVVMLGGQKHIVNGFTYQIEGRLVGESYSFSPGQGITIHYGVKPYNNAIPKQSDYSDIKETLIAILESYQSTGVLPSPLPWVTLSNDNGYSFQHPANRPTGSNQYVVGDTSKASAVVWNGMGVRAISSLFSPAGKCAGVESNNIDALEYAQRVWEINANDENPNIFDKEVGNLEKVTIGGREAHQFILTQSFSSACGGHTLGEEHKFIFAEHDGKIFEISLPTNDPILEGVLRTFTWN